MLQIPTKIEGYTMSTINWLHSVKLPQQERGTHFPAQNPMEQDRAACEVAEATHRMYQHAYCLYTRIRSLVMGSD